MEQDNIIETNGQQESRQDQGQGSNPTLASDFKAPGSQSELDSMINKAVQTALSSRNKGEQERTAQAVADALQKKKIMPIYQLRIELKKSSRISKRALRRNVLRSSMKSLLLLLRKIW